MQLKQPEPFARQFIQHFLQNGFGSLPKREIEVLVMHLLLEDGCLGESAQIDHHQLSMLLKLPETRVRSLVYEVELKYGQQPDAVDGIIGLIDKGRYEIVGTKVRFAVHSPLLKQFLEYEIRQLDGVSDGSFGKHIVTLELSTFQKLLEHLYGDRPLPETIKTAMPAESRQLDKEGMIKAAFGEFMKSFATRSGTRCADLMFDAIDPIGFLRQVFGRV
ncbi:hypothetical protein [Geoalkalibacter halelectricus]|uniref:Uncharacterized protein n=1 Tax=Geoalkalibacter halelectricus TaxID=2847045 RepID=A0ABY5ZNX4_9BACT|nr:hypothetical protein [Geoalkalibacter halelectricus]MDO3377831.1 hypothetical protein [Geoalkalibacter halelectricus]UWZ79580.1 hypothetical protein L9S41_18145 [Geoalkalibacter halelectricus]